MKILEVVSYFYPALTYGGPAKVVYDLSAELAKRSEVVVFTTDVWDENKRISANDKIKSTKNFQIKYFPNLINSIAFRYRFFTGFGMVFEYLKRKNAFDIVHIHDVFIIPQLLIAFFAIFFGKPFIVSPHGVLEPKRLEDKSYLKKVLYSLLAKPVLLYAKTLVATSENEKAILEQLGFNKVTTVFNGVSMEHVKPTSRFQKFKNNKLFTILYIGKIHPLKGLEDLVMAVKGADFDCELLIAGPDDGGKKRLENLIKEKNLKNIFFLGLVNEREKAELFSLADLFVYPSHSEGFAISILEAMKYKVPILITDACNFPDVNKFDAGIIIGEKNLVKWLEEALVKIKRKEYNLEKLAENGKKLIERDYSISAMAQKIERIYEVYN